MLPAKQTAILNNNRQVDSKLKKAKHDYLQQVQVQVIMGGLISVDPRALP